MVLFWCVMVVWGLMAMVPLVQAWGDDHGV
jgi:hypothetical protein